ncbi:hypothetical protein KDK_32480 [Dictyobacter kobayashii]|uniref:Uncharacterized protein n=1 Tax=Dictyobacter kobayashii TaxID=2014872 RepID=A0A402AJT7_9CHLR|nr:hypothetical protein KDK_32480 [Dictyobacter kobayashii]
MYLHLAEHFPAKNYYRKAWNAFDTAANIQLLHDRGISEIIIDQADVAQGMGELPLYVDHLRRGIMSAATLGSQRRYNEAYAVYQKVPKKWLSEKQFLLLARDIFGGQLPESE